MRRGREREGKVHVPSYFPPFPFFLSARLPHLFIYVANTWKPGPREFMNSLKQHHILFLFTPCVSRAAETNQRAKSTEWKQGGRDPCCIVLLRVSREQKKRKGGGGGDSVLCNASIVTFSVQILLLR